MTLFEQLLPDPLPEDGTVPYLLPPYQQAVSALGTALLASGRTQQAHAAFRQAVAMAERLVEVNPQAYEPRLLDDLSSLGVVCSMTGRHEEALETLELALTRFERLARTNPVLHEADLARVLVHLTETYAREKGPQAALAAAEQAVDIYRRLTAGHPRVYELTFAQALYLRGVNLARLEAGTWTRSTPSAMPSPCNAGSRTPRHRPTRRDWRSFWLRSRRCAELPTPRLTKWYGTESAPRRAPVPRIRRDGRGGRPSPRGRRHASADRTPARIESLFSAP